MADLAAFLSLAGQTAFQWGRHDCSLMEADWLLEHGYPDTAHDLRGAYDSALSCQRLLRARGGLLSVFTECAARAALERTYEPKRGDVGVVEFRTTEGHGMIGAICTGPRWAMLSVNGLLSAPASPLAAWSVG